MKLLKSAFDWIAKKKSYFLVALAAGFIGFAADLTTLAVAHGDTVWRAVTTTVPAWALALAFLIGLGLALIVARRIFLRPDRPSSRTTPDISIYSRDEFYSNIQRHFAKAQKQVRVHSLSKDWIFPVITSLIHARMRGVSVDVHCTDGHHERYNLLENLGCKVERITDGEAPMVLRDPKKIRLCGASVRCPRKSDNVYGREYSSSFDWHAIRSLDLLFEEHSGPAIEFDPNLIKIDENEIFAKLVLAPHYRKAKFAMIDVRLEDIRPNAGRVLQYKLDQVALILEMYDKEDWRLFAPCGVKLANGQVSAFVPPVVEKQENGELVVAEGHSRLFHLWRDGRGEVSVIEVSGASTPLKPTIGNWDEVQVVTGKDDIGDPNLARYIETTAHKGVWSSVPNQQVGA